MSYTACASSRECINDAALLLDARACAALVLAAGGCNVASEGAAAECALSVPSRERARGGLYLCCVRRVCCGCVTHRQ